MKNSFINLSGPADLLVRSCLIALTRSAFEKGKLSSSNITAKSLVSYLSLN